MIESAKCKPDGPPSEGLFLSRAVLEKFQENGTMNPKAIKDFDQWLKSVTKSYSEAMPGIFIVQFR